MNLQLNFPSDDTHLKRPLLSSPASCGRPDIIEQHGEWIDLNEYVQGRSGSVYYIRAFGDSMVELGILDGDLLIVDRLKQPETNDIVIAEISGGHTVKLLKKRERKLYLVPANGAYPTHQINSKDDFAVWGVVTHVLHKFK